MSEDAPVIVLLVLSVFMGIATLVSLAQLPNKTEKDAVKAGAARWISDNEGNPKLQWIVPLEAKP